MNRLLTSYRAFALLFLFVYDYDQKYKIYRAAPQGAWNYMASLWRLQIANATKTTNMQASQSATQGGISLTSSYLYLVQFIHGYNWYPFSSQCIICVSGHGVKVCNSPSLPCVIFLCIILCFLFLLLVRKVVSHRMTPISFVVVAISIALVIRKSVTSGSLELDSGRRLLLFIIA